MSLSKSQVIDRVILSPDKGRIILLAIDDGEIAEPGAREAAFTDKLQTYLEFYVSKQYLKTAPDHARLPVEIVAVCTTPPTGEMMKIKGTRDHDRPDTFLPVIVTTVQNFKAAISRPTANQSPEPMLSSGTSPAGQEPRHP
jgi:hypothetical protein